MYVKNGNVLLYEIPNELALYSETIKQTSQAIGKPMKKGGKEGVGRGEGEEKWKERIQMICKIRHEPFLHCGTMLHRKLLLYIDFPLKELSS